MGRGQTTDEFAAEFVAKNPLLKTAWPHFGGLPGDPGIVSYPAREYGDRYGLDAEALDEAAEADGWEWHDHGYDEKIREVAERLAEAVMDTDTLGL